MSSIRSRTLQLLLVTALLVGLTAHPGASAERGRATERVLHLVDPSRTIRLPDGRRVLRPVTTYVRFPVRKGGPWPLVVFGHGFATTPGIYAQLLRWWALAGYVVAAPLFPLGNEHAPGGPNEADIVNQPADISFVISQLLAASASPTNPLHRLIDPSRIAVAGQSDGGLTAFAVTYDKPFRDPRIDAAVVLSGGRLPGRTFRFPRPSPPLLVVQGTADTINPVRYAREFYRAATRPKFLLLLRGAGHLLPYTVEQPQLSVVEQATTAFLDRYLEHGPPGALEQTVAATPGIASLTARP
ncbi:MAG TPA: hypothetical protein VNC40_00110 [Gaiellaceae bacterium]|nr:hypothetical protein [Gaiellaceae bacterium]